MKTEIIIDKDMIEELKNAYNYDSYRLATAQINGDIQGQHELKGRLEGIKDILEMLGINVKVVGFNDCICHVTYPISNLSIKEEVLNDRNGNT